MQPDTTPLKLVQDLNTKLSKRQHGPAETKMLSSDKQGAEPAPSKSSSTEYQNLPTIPVTGQSCQVVPLYTPSGSTVKLFCVHPSHRFALSLAPMATGFQYQVSIWGKEIGNKEILLVLFFPKNTFPEITVRRRVVSLFQNDQKGSAALCCCTLLLLLLLLLLFLFLPRPTYISVTLT